MLEDDSRESKQNIIILYLCMASAERSGPLLVLCGLSEMTEGEAMTDSDLLEETGMSAC